MFLKLNSFYKIQTSSDVCFTVRNISRNIRLLSCFLVCPGRGNASADCPSTHLCHRLLPVPVLPHSGHSPHGHAEVSAHKENVIIPQSLYLLYLKK